MHHWEERSVLSRLETRHRLIILWVPICSKQRCFLVISRTRIIQNLPNSLAKSRRFWKSSCSISFVLRYDVFAKTIQVILFFVVQRAWSWLYRLESGCVWIDFSEFCVIVFCHGKSSCFWLKVNLLINARTRVVQVWEIFLYHINCLWSHGEADLGFRIYLFNVLK